MQAITDTTGGLSLLIGPNRDRLPCVLTVAPALGASAWPGGMGLQAMVPAPPAGF